MNSLSIGAGVANLVAGFPFAPTTCPNRSNIEMEDIASKARTALAAKRNYTGIRYGGNPPDAGSAYLDGQRVAWVPVDLLNMNGDQFDCLLTMYRSKGATLSRQETRIAVS